MSYKHEFVQSRELDNFPKSSKLYIQEKQIIKKQCIGPAINTTFCNIKCRIYYFTIFCGVVVGLLPWSWNRKERLMYRWSTKMLAVWNFAFWCITCQIGHIIVRTLLQIVEEWPLNFDKVLILTYYCSFLCCSTFAYLYENRLRIYINAAIRSQDQQTFKLTIFWGNVAVVLRLIIFIGLSLKVSGGIWRQLRVLIDLTSVSELMLSLASEFYLIICAIG